MTKRSGRDIYEQKLEELYTKAPTIWAIGKYSGVGSTTSKLIGETIGLLLKKYRKRLSISSEAEFGGIFNHTGDKRLLAAFVSGDGPTITDIVDRIDGLADTNGFGHDKDVVVATLGTSFYERTLSGYELLLVGDILEPARARANAYEWQVDLLPIVAIGPRDTSPESFTTTNSIVFSELGSHPIIMLFGTKPDEAYSFVIREGRIEPLTNIMIVNMQHVAHTAKRRVEIFSNDDQTATVANLFGAYKPGLSEESYDVMPKYKEVYSLVNAASIPFGEAIRIAIGIEHSIDLSLASPTTRSVEELANEAIAVWGEGKYITSNDTVQPGLSRTGSIVYVSKLLGEVAVLSFNLKLAKEQ